LILGYSVEAVDKKKFRAEAHTLKPVVMIGQSGLTASVLAEIELTLSKHELIKIKIRAEREERKKMSEKICLDTKAELIQLIGACAVIYRLNPNK
jgi:RNA-binding protein